MSLLKYISLCCFSTLKSIAMRIISSIRFPHTDTTPRKPKILIPRRKSHDAWSMSTTPDSTCEPSPSPIPRFRPRTPEQAPSSPVGMASMDITQSEEAVALTTYRLALGRPWTWPLSQSQSTPFLANKPEYQPPTDRLPIKLNDPAPAPPVFPPENGVWVSAREIAHAPENEGNGGRAQAESDVRGEETFVDVPLTPPPVPREEGAEAWMVVVVWRWFCGWVVG